MYMYVHCTINQGGKNSLPEQFGKNTIKTYITKMLHMTVHL